MKNSNEIKKTPRMKNIKGNTKKVDQKIIDKVQSDYEKDKERGLYDWATKDGYSKLVRYLYDPYSQQKFRKCKDLYVENKILYFETREKKKYVAIQVLDKSKTRVMYKIYDGDMNMLEAKFSQDEVIEWCRDNIEF